MPSGATAPGNASGLADAKAPARRKRDGDCYTIGELARELSLTHRTIRYYEDEGLIAPAREGQTRLYSRRDRARLMLICRGKRLGFSIAQIREFLTLYDVDRTKREQMQYLLGLAQERIDVLEQQKQDVVRTLEELRKVERDILDHLGESLEK